MKSDKRLEQVKKWMEDAKNEWFSKNGTKEQIRRGVLDILNRNVQSIISKLLGFDDHWGGDRWEVDHCNGRSGNSAAGDFIREQAGEAVNEWLKEQARKLPQLPKKAIISLRAEYLEQLQKNLSRNIREKAATDANQMYLKLIEDSCKCHEEDQS